MPNYNNLSPREYAGRVMGHFLLGSPAWSLVFVPPHHFPTRVRRTDTLSSTHSQTCLPTCLIWKGEAQESSHNVQTCGDENRRVGVPNVCGNYRRHQTTNAIGRSRHARACATVDAGYDLGRVTIKRSPHDVLDKAGSAIEP